MPDGKLKTAIDALVERELLIAEAARAAYANVQELELEDVGVVLNTYRWWRPDMALPALWNWLTPADTDRPDNCHVEDTLRVTVSIAVDPQLVAGEGEMLELEEYVDLALPILDGEVYGRSPFGQRVARRRGFQTVAGALGDVNTLELEIPLEVELKRSVPQTP